MRFTVAITAAMLAAPALAQDAAPDFAKPGTEVAVGTKVVIPHQKVKGPEVPVELTVTAIEQGSTDDIKDFNVPAELKDYVPYYVRYTWTNLSDEDLSHESLGAFYIIDDREQQQSNVRTEGQRFEKCAPGGTVKDMTKGVSAEGCKLYMIHKDGTLKSVIYKGKNPDDMPAVKAIYADPIRWVPKADAGAAPAAETPSTDKGKVVN